MNMDMSKNASINQWGQIIDGMRKQIAEQVPMMAAMKPEELKQFFEAARQLEALEQDILTQEAEVEKRVARAKLSFPYGD
jgi:hypothetical protein